MNFLKTILAGFCSLLGSYYGQSQQPVPTDSIRPEATIQYQPHGNQVEFNSITPPLQQISGAPEAFYTYYWEFGDGQYSFAEKPKHTYAEPGQYNVNLWVTNNYDNGKPPPSRPKTVTIKEMSTPPGNPSASLSNEDVLLLQKNREPLPDQEMVFIVTYKNPNDYPSSGRLYIYYNEDRFKADNFDFYEFRVHHGERVINEPVLLTGMFSLDPSVLIASAATYNLPSTPADSSQKLQDALKQAESIFRNSKTFEFDHMPPGEERNIFLTLHTTPEMLKDTSAVIKVRSIYIPDRTSKEHSIKDLEMEIVTSHDPNKMAVSDTRLNFRHAENKQLNFKIRFQNNGEGPASTIRLDVDVHEIFDPSTVEVLDLYPPCEICPDGQEASHSCLDTLFTPGKISFIFRNIYLPGSRQKNVNDRDSTKGFVKYAIKLNERPRKQTSACRTAIIFDKNDPIYTNQAKTRFAMGTSLGIKLTYQHTDISNLNGFLLGCTLSPYKSFKSYGQAELMMGKTSYSSEEFFQVVGDTNALGEVEARRVTQVSDFEITTAYLVPASYRYSITSYLGIGGGIQLSTALQKKIFQATTERSYFLAEQGQIMIPNPDGDTYQESTTKYRFTDFDTAFFADMCIGSVRIGPSLGIRYLYHFNKPVTRWQFYALWKF